MSAGTSYWLGVVGSGVTPACTDLNIYAVRKSGAFATTSSSQSLIFNIWPSLADFIAAPNGDTKCFVLVTDGAGSLGAKTWFAPQSICFQKSC